MPNPLWLDLLQPRLARALGRPARFPARWTTATTVALSGGHARVWDSGGAGPALVWMPDPPVVIECYAELAALLTPSHRLIIAEVPGIGFGIPAPGFRFSVASIAGAIVDVVTHLDLYDVTLVGTCLGGYAAQAAAGLAPSRIRRLALLQTPGWTDGQSWLERRDPDRLLRRPWVGQAGFQLLARSRTARWFQFAAADGDRADALARVARSALEHGACFCLPSLFQQYLDPRQVAPAPPPVPTLVVVGGADRSHSPTDWAAAPADARYARRIMLEDVGHFPDLEAGPRFADLIARFVSEHR
jgi:pimeloyl-ACP methyl ester carboxylesterase